MRLVKKYLRIISASKTSCGFRCEKSHCLKFFGGTGSWWNPPPRKWTKRHSKVTISKRKRVFQRAFFIIFHGDMLVSGGVRVKKHHKKGYGSTEKQQKIVNMTWVEKPVASFHPKTTNPKPYRQDFGFVGDVGSFKLYQTQTNIEILHHPHILSSFLLHIPTLHIIFQHFACQPSWW